MDRAFRLHYGCLRKVMNKHGGYEFAEEVGWTKGLWGFGRLVHKFPEEVGCFNGLLHVEEVAMPCLLLAFPSSKCMPFQSCSHPHFHPQGDSLSIAFATPEASLAFSLEAQSELLTLPYPAELLVHPLCPTLWLTK